MTGLAVAPEASAPPARWTVLEVIRWTVARFTERDLATPRLDAELLVAHALGLPRLQLYVQFDRPLLPDELAAIRALIKRRQAGESVAYLVGKKEFSFRSSRVHGQKVSHSPLLLIVVCRRTS